MDVASLRVMFTAGGDGTVTRAIDTVNRKLDTVDTHARKAGSSIDSVFKVAGGVLVARGVELVAQNIVGMASGILAAHSNAEQLRVSLDIAVGSASEANKIFSELQKIAAATPFQFPELVQSAVRLESFGLDALDVMDTLGDTAAGMGRSLEQVTAAYLDAGMGQFIRLQELGIDAAVVGEEVVFSWVENGKTIRKAVDKNNQELIRSTVAAIWNDKYAGAMEKQSRTFAGQWSTLKDNATLAAMNITAPLFDGLTGVLDFANDVFAVGLTDAVRGITGPLEDMADIVAAAFDAFASGEGIDDLMAGLFGPGSPMAGAPDLLQDVTREILNIADAIGDIRVGGADALFGELSNIADAGIELGEIAVKATFKLVTNIVGSLYGWVKEQLFGPAANEDPMLRGLGGVGIESGMSISFGDVLIEVGVRLGGFAAEIAGNLWGWVKAQLFGVAATGDPMLAGLGGVGIGTGAQTISIGDVLIEITDIVVGGIAGWAADATPAIQAWLDTNKLSGFTQIIDVESFMPAFESAETGDYETAILAYLNADPIEITPNIELKIAEAVEGIFTGGAGGEGGGISQPDWSVMAEWLQAGFKIANPMSIVADDIAVALQSALTGALDGLFQGETTYNMMTGTSTTSGGGAGWLAGVADSIITNFKDLPRVIAEGVGTLSLDVIPKPTLPAWLDTDWSWITGPIATLTGYIDELLDLIGQAISARTTADAAMGVQPLMPFGMGGDAPRMSINRQVEEQIIDVNPVMKLMPKFDVSGVGAAADTALSSVKELAETTYSATLDADSGPFAIKYTEASGWGDVFANQTWTATFDADNGPAAVAYTEAFGWGNTWAAQTFTATASISVNTSALWGAVADVGNAMAAIRELLPSSPAKKGPFAGPTPNLDYIADSFRASFDRMRSDAESGVAGVRGTMNGRGGRGARSGDAGFVLNNPTINIHPADDDVQRAFTSAIVGDWR